MAIGTGGQIGRDPAAAFSTPYGLTTVGGYALVAQRHMQKYGTTSEQLAEIAVTMRRHAGLNPGAKMRSPISIGDVLASRMISEPLHLLDCCIMSDGGGALVVTSAGWGDCPALPEQCSADLNYDCVVGILDLLTLLANWGP